MSSHFHAVGFPIESEAQFQQIAEVAANTGRVFPVEGGTYVRWEVGEGVELWVQADDENTVRAVSPHFFGEGRVRAGLVERIPRPDDAPFDAGFHAFAGPRADKVDGDTPFVFDAPDARRYLDLPLPTLVELQLAGFAHQLVSYPSEGAYRAAQPEFRLSVGRFEPLKPPPDAPPDAPPEAFARLSGVVVAAGERVNPFSNAPFVWARLQVPGGEVDVVADPDLALQGRPTVGGVVDGLFWLSGRITRTL